MATAPLFRVKGRGVIGLYQGEVSSQSNKSTQVVSSQKHKLQSSEGEMIHHLIYGDSAEWEKSKHKQTLRRR